MDLQQLIKRGVDTIVPEKSLMQKLDSGKKMRVYFGIDPTSTNIHLGHTVPLRKLRDFQNAGHHIIFLVGSFTAMIGDPTDKKAMRQPLTQEQVEENFRAYKRQASKIIDFENAEIVYNADWLGSLSFKNIIELSQKFTVQQMLERDMYQKRMEEGKPIGLHEFFYPLMQGYDSVHLEVDLEIGGTDQLFNMLAGRSLLRAYKDMEKCVLTTPLIEGTDGRKMSKTYGNAINVSDIPSEMFGKIMSMKDDLIVKYFIYLTDFSIKEIDGFDKEIKDGVNPRDLKVKLAKEIVTMYHSKEDADAAEQEFVNVFKKGGVPDDIPEFAMNGDRNIIDLLELCKLIDSRADGKRLIKQGGVKINDQKVDDMNAIIHLEKDMVVQVGKRRFAKIV